MNMLIARMGDTYEEFTTKRDTIIYMSRVGFMNEFSMFGNIKDHFKESDYLYIIQEQESDGKEQKSWEGKLT